MDNKIRGDRYELQIYNYLILNYTDYKIFMWRDVPIKYIIKYNFDDITKYENNNLDDEKSNSIDIGCDILMVNKIDEEIIIVQCKNYNNKKVCVSDLAGFSHMIAFSPIPIKGLIISNTELSNVTMFKLPHTQNIKFLQIPYEEKENIIIEKIIISRDYQLEAVEKFKNLDKGILQLFCGMGKTHTSILISQNFKNIIILSPLKCYATQNLNVFTNSLKDYSSNLISQDGERNIEKILNFKKEKNIYSSTFCSADVVINLIEHLENTILIIDEFHNLSYNNISNNNCNIYKILTSNKISKKLFMSATPIIYEVIDEENVIEHETKNNIDIFGDIFYSYKLTKAIENKYVNEYQFIIPNYEHEKDKILFLYSNMLYHGYKKCLVYCKNIEETTIYMDQLLELNKQKYNFKIFIEKINHKTSLKKRNKILSEFINEDYKLSFIFSVHTIDECIDIPKCDSVYLTYCVKNPINIIQRISRCLRIYTNKIKSGIFLWCKNYIELNKINKILQSCDIELTKSIYIINDINNEIKKKLKINLKNAEKNNIVNNAIHINNTNDNLDVIKNLIIVDEKVKIITTIEKEKRFMIDITKNLNLTDSIINLLSQIFNVSNLSKFTVSSNILINILSVSKRSDFHETIKRSYLLNVDYILTKSNNKGIGKNNEKIYMLSPKCAKCIINVSRCKNKIIIDEMMFNFEVELYKKCFFLYNI
jgi:superfamily II DNA or RNA helicase